jgi:hypothetical protein
MSWNPDLSALLIATKRGRNYFGRQEAALERKRREALFLAFQKSKFPFGICSLGDVPGGSRELWKDF